MGKWQHDARSHASAASAGLSAGAGAGGKRGSFSTISTTLFGSPEERGAWADSDERAGARTGATEVARMPSAWAVSSGPSNSNDRDSSAGVPTVCSPIWISSFGNLEDGESPGGGGSEAAAGIASQGAPQEVA